MRKHRISGVVIAILIGLGTFAHRSDSLHGTPGPSGAGVQLTSAELPAGVTVAPASRAAVVHETAAVAATGRDRQALFDLVLRRAVANLSSPFGTQALVWDVRVAQLTQRAEVTAALAADRAEVAAYQAAVARRQAEGDAYLKAVAARIRLVPVVAAARSAPAPVPAPAVRPAPAPPDPFVALRQCESGDNYRDDTGNGYYGAYQFSLGTWRSLGLGGLPSQASPAQQDQAAQDLQARRRLGPVALLRRADSA